MSKPKFRSHNVVAVKVNGFPVKILGRARKAEGVDGYYYDVYKLYREAESFYQESELRPLRGAEKQP